MHKNSIMHKLLALIVPVALLGLMLLASCESEKEKIVEVEKVVHDTIAVEIINVSGNDSVAQGGKVTFTAEPDIRLERWFITGSPPAVLLTVPLGIQLSGKHRMTPGLMK
jgi:hypothetical protein